MAGGTQMDSLTPVTPPRPTATDIAETCPKTPTLLAYGTRCGKPGCRCTCGELHRTRYLRWREGGRHRRRYVPLAEVAQVEAILARRRQAAAEARLQALTDAQLIRQLEARYRALLELCRG